MEIIALCAPIVIGVLVLKYYHKIPSREMMWHRGAAWCAANRDACVLRKQRKQEYLKMNAPEVDDAASAKA